MPKPIGAFSPEAIIQAIEDNLVGASVALGRTEDGVVFRGKDVTWVYTGHRSLSRVLKARFTADQAEDRVAQIFDCFRTWDAPVSWVVGPTTWPPKLAGVLKENGFDGGHVWTGLARDLPTDDAAAPSIPGLQVTLATTAEELTTWTAITASPSQISPVGDREIEATMPELFSPDNAGGDPRCKFYLAFHDGLPVARGMAFLNGEVVGLYWVNASADQAGRGYELALARRALADARSAGAQLAVIPAHGDVQALGQQLGFSPYCQFHVHAWPPTTFNHA